MKVTLRELFETKNFLSQLVQSELKASSAFKLSKTLKKVSNELDDVESQRHELLEKYGVANESGGLSVPDETRSDFMKEFDELLDTQVEIDVKRVCIQDLVTSDGTEINVSPTVLFNLDWLLEE